VSRKNEYRLWLRPPLWKNGESCVTVGIGPVTRTASIVAYGRLKALAVNGAVHAANVSSYASLIGVNLRRLKASQRE